MPDLFRKIDAMPVGVCVCVCVVLVCGLERLYVGIQVRGCLCMFVGVCAGVDGWVSLSLCLPHKHTNSLELSVCVTLFLLNFVASGICMCIVV